jgi:hypothetical protein
MVRGRRRGIRLFHALLIMTTMLTLLCQLFCGGVSQGMRRASVVVVVPVSAQSRLRSGSESDSCVCAVNTA